MNMREQLKPIKQYSLKKKEQAKYVPILDRDPVFAARYLTKKDIGEVYKLLKTAFEEIERDEVYHEPLVHTITFNYENFQWFASFFKELENILEVEKTNIPFDKCPSCTLKRQHRPPFVYQPFYFNGGKLRTPNIVSKSLPTINNYRILYLMEGYDMSDFKDDCYPEWYLIATTTVFEQYSEKTNTRVRVDFRDGEFSYFIAGASDNWKKIEGVPLEMDHVIGALIFRSYSEI